MKLHTASRKLIIGLAAVLFFASCSAFSSISSASAESDSSSQATSSQAAYRRLSLSDDAAWSAAVAAGQIREGSVLVKTDSAFDASALASLGATETGRIALGGATWLRLSVAAGTERGVIASLRAVAGVEVAEPENMLHMPKGESVSGEVNGTSADIKALSAGALDDPYVASAEYSLTISHAIEAYENSAYALDGTKVAYAAALDTGIDLAHEEFIDSSGASIVALAKSAFKRNSATSYTYIGTDNPFVSITVGNKENWDDDGHGTHVAGIMGALGNNGKGTAGVMWKGLKLISYKVLADYEADNDQGSGSDWAVFGALEDLADWWAVQGNHPDTTQITLPVNMSLGSSYASSFEIEAIAYALKKNVLVFAAMGNDGSATVEYPAGYSGVVAVGATTGIDTKAEFSTSGSWMSVCAPGYDIISTYNGSSSDYEWLSGTSMAAPFVTGLAAYMLACAPDLEPGQVKAVLEQTADKIGDATGYSSDFGYGRVDALASLDLATGKSGTLPAAGVSYSVASIVVSVTASGSALKNQWSP
jgi:subtilisin family serine protease